MDQFGALRAALASQVEATTGFEHTLALWRHQAMSATIQFLDDAMQQGEQAPAARSNGRRRSPQRPMSDLG